MKIYNHAIEIDPQCVDAYVAKGAAYANQEHYELAIRNFEKALDINPDCANAKLYLEATEQKKATVEEEEKRERRRREKEEEKRRKEKEKDVRKLKITTTIVLFF